MLLAHNDCIVFAGDSVTDMGSQTPVGEGLFENLGSGKSYVRQVESLLAAVYPEREIRVVNAGISGNTSRDLLSRWERDVLPYHPQWVSICIGINDVWRQFDCPAQKDWHVSPEEYRENVEKMILSVKGTAKGILLITPYYMEPCKQDALCVRMAEYADVLRALAEKHGCTFVDLQAAFDAYFQYRHSSYIAWDRIHPNYVGAAFIARLVLSHLGFDYNHVPCKGE